MSTQVIQVTSERDTLIMERELGEFMQNDDMDGGDSLLENISSTRRIQTHPIIEKYQKTIQDLTHQLDDTKDKLQRLESVQPSLQAALAKANTAVLQQSSSLQKFSSSNQPRKTNSNHRRRKLGGRISANSSTTTGNGYAARITTKLISARRPIITKSTSTTSRNNNNKQKKHVRIKSPHDICDDEYEDEGFVNDLQDDGIRHEEVKESIAKVREDIRKSLQVLELVKVTRQIKEKKTPLPLILFFINSL
jgi:hypothetical protein